jgi:hypothetical protein
VFLKKKVREKNFLSIFIENLEIFQQIFENYKSSWLALNPGLQISLKIRLRSEAKAKFFSLKIAKRSEAKIIFICAKRSDAKIFSKLRKNANEI